MIIRAIVSGFALLPSMLLPAQDVPTWHPILGAAPDLSPERFALFAWYNAAMGSEAELSPADQTRYDSLFFVLGETFEGPCDIIGMECSWYCGGGPDTVWASSTLPPTKIANYAPQNAHDLDYCTAWCEAVEGPGIGEKLFYRFAPESPRSHTITVVNGYVKDPGVWRSNNRVARLLLAQNGTPMAVLELVDTPSQQSFKVPLLGRRTDGEAMLLTFEILGVFKGEVGDDTVISEIYFDGTDVH